MLVVWPVGSSKVLQHTPLIIVECDWIISEVPQLPFWDFDTVIDCSSRKTKSRCVFLYSVSGLKSWRSRIEAWSIQSQKRRSRRRKKILSAVINCLKWWSIEENEISVFLPRSYRTNSNCVFIMEQLLWSALDQDESVNQTVELDGVRICNVMASPCCTETLRHLFADGWLYILFGTDRLIINVQFSAFLSPKDFLISLGHYL